MNMRTSENVAGVFKLLLALQLESGKWGVSQRGIVEKIVGQPSFCPVEHFSKTIPNSLTNVMNVYI